jgi:hypothetical protein
MSVSRGGGSGVSSIDGLNWATVAEADANTDGDGVLYRVSEDLPDKHVMAVHAIRASLSDVHDGQAGQIEIWVYADSDMALPTGTWVDRVENSDDFLWHSNLGTVREDTATYIGNTPFSDQTQFPLPVLRADGGLTVVQSGTSESPGNMEWELTVLYDVVPAESTDDYLEMLLKS